MATLQNIRKRGPLVAIVIGIALLAFILGDAVRSGEMLFSQSRFEMGEVAGKSIQIQDYQNRVEEVLEIYKMRSGGSVDQATTENIRKQIWDQMVRTHVLEDEYNELGVNVSSEELFDMVQGTNIDPTVRQLFANPKTGEFNRALVIQFLKSINKDANNPNRQYWLYIENEIKNNRKFAKYLNLISKGLYVTNKEAKAEYMAEKKKVNLSYISKAFNTVPDSAISVTQSEIADYYDKHIDEFKQQESRDIQYYTFDVRPSLEDKKDAERWIKDAKREFENTKNVEQFLRLKDPENRLDRKHYKEEELPTNLQVFMFSAKEGDVFGPYLEKETYKLAKLIETIELPDSVKARHILIRPKAQTPEAYAEAKTKIDSLKQLITKGEDFAKLAKDNSMDGSAKEGGDLGWFNEGTMVQAFNDSCFYGKPGDIKVVETQFGVHLIEILEQGAKVNKVRFATLNRTIEASSDTKNEIYSAASQFIGQNNTAEKLDKAAAERKMTPKRAKNLAPMAKNIAGLQNARELVRAAYKTEKGKIIKDDKNNPIFELGNSFVVGKVIEINEKGEKPLAKVKDIVRVRVLKEKKAKAIVNEFKNAMASAKTIKALAQKMGLEVKNAEEVNFNMYQLKGAGFEPKVVSAAVNLPKDVLSEPIDGNTGVYVITVTGVNKTEDSASGYFSEKQKVLRGLRSRTNYQVYESLKENANIVDKRSKFY